MVGPPPSGSLLALRPTIPSAAAPLAPLELLVRMGIGAAIAFQLVQRVLHHGLEQSPYARSLWYVTYELGFVRRGLAGEGLRRALGHTPTLTEVAVVQTAITLTVLTAVLALVIALVRRRTVLAYAVAGVLAISPLGFDLVVGSRRPDLVSFLPLVAIGWWAARRARSSVRVALACGCALAVVALVSEPAVLIVGPWLVLVVAVHARARGATVRGIGAAMTTAAAPAIAVLAWVAAQGPPSTTTVKLLELRAPLGVEGVGTVFPYLDDTVIVSVGTVFHRRPGLSLVLGALLVGLLWCVTRSLHAYVREVVRWALPDPLLRRSWMVGTGACVALLFALGFDWLRWITSVAFAATLAAAAIVLVLEATPATSRPPGSRPWFDPLPRRLRASTPAVLTAVAATYLAAVAPLPTAVRGLGDLADLVFFTGVPGR